jgi:hypothetical protein
MFRVKVCKVINYAWCLYDPQYWNILVPVSGYRQQQKKKIETLIKPSLRGYLMGIRPLKYSINILGGNHQS